MASYKANGRICGTGEACEAVCPMKAIGRVCPTIAGALSELESINHPWVDVQLSPVA